MPNQETILIESNKYLAKLDKSASVAVNQLMHVYKPIREQLLQSLKEMEHQMLQVDNPTPTQLYKMERYRRFLLEVNNQMERYGKAIASKSITEIDKAAKLAIDYSDLAIGEKVGIAGNFMKMDVKGVERATGIVSAKSPLKQMLAGKYGEAWATTFAVQFVTGVSLGLSPREISKRMQGTLDNVVPADMNRIVRTTQIQSYREVNLDQWRQSGVVDGWFWSSAMDYTTCASCWSQHGTFHSIFDSLSDHHCGRCAPIPHVIGDPMDQIKTGEQNFMELSDDKQQQIAKNGGWSPLYRAWKGGAIQWNQMSVQTDGGIWGQMYVAPSLKSILGGDSAKQFYSGWTSPLNPPPAHPVFNIADKIAIASHSALAASADTTRSFKQAEIDIWNKISEKYINSPAIALKIDIMKTLARVSGVSEDKIHSLVSAWANSSMHMDILTFKKAVARLIPGVELSNWENNFYNPNAESYKNSHNSKYDATDDDRDRIAKAMYEEQQKWFKDNGIKTVTLYRGIRKKRSMTATPDEEIGMEVGWNGNSLDSWTLNPEIAVGFSEGSPTGQTGNYAYIVKSDVPVERIFTSARNGFGCYSEYEFVVMGGKNFNDKVTIVKMKIK